MRPIRDVFRNRRGTTAVEYCLIGAGIAAALVVAVFAIGDDMRSIWEGVGSNLGRR